MQTATFWGSSDDLIEVEGVKGGDEFGAEGRRGTLAGSFILAGSGGSMRVFAHYDGCWCFAPALVDEGEPLPDWPVRLKTADNEYSVRLEIDVPDDVRVIRESRRSED